MCRPLLEVRQKLALAWSAHDDVWRLLVVVVLPVVAAVWAAAVLLQLAVGVFMFTVALTLASLTLLSP
jgi:hypothetical protein